MSQVLSVRLRSPRSSAAAAVERARLSLVMPRRSAAPRAPFAVLVFLILGAGVVGLLMFNTQMQQASIYATELQDKADRLQARSQALNDEVDDLRDPQHLGVVAAALGMVNPPNPAFVNLMDGRIDGAPVPAAAEDRTKVRPNPMPLPPIMNRTPIIQEVIGAASTTTGTPGDRNEARIKPAHGDSR